MTYGIVIIIFLIALALCEMYQLYANWSADQEARKFRDVYIKILKKHDAILFPSQIKSKGKVIPYVRPIRKNK
jgi:hypothetical protein